MSKPSVTTSEPARPRVAGNRHFGGNFRPAYDAGNLVDPHTRDWQPFLWSPDGELNPYRNMIVARMRDLVRNDGWASAAVTRTLDNVIGADFRPVSKPDYYALRQLTGVKEFDHVWAEEFGRAAESHFKTWSLDGGRYCDVERSLTVPQLFGVGFRHKIVDGDGLAVMHWLPERTGRGAARYCTAMQLVDPDRLSNPFFAFDTNVMRGGVEIDRLGAPTAYHIEKAHIGDWYNAKDSMTWERVPRETPWGRSIVIHDFDHERAAQHRGVGMLAPVLTRLKMLIKYDGTELDAAIVNAIFGAYISSPYDKDMIESALGEKDDSSLGMYQDIRADFHKDAPIKLDGVRMPMLAPGEEIETVRAERPSANFAAFESAVLRNVAAGCGTSAQQISQNWSEVNYSSYRAAMLEAWKTFHRRRVHFAVGFAQPVFTNWLEEAFELDDLPLPSRAPEFIDFRSLYARAKWLGPGKGYVDELAEKQGSILAMDASLSTLEEEVGTLTGQDWREVLDQRAIEIKEFEKRGIAPPKWTGEMGNVPSRDQTAKKTIKAPEAT